MEKQLETSIRQALGKRIKVKRKALGINADTLARMTGVSRANQFRYEKGEISIKADTLVNIAEALNTSPNELLGWNKQGGTQ